MSTEASLEATLHKLAAPKYPGQYLQAGGREAARLEDIKEHPVHWITLPLLPPFSPNFQGEEKLPTLATAKWQRIFKATLIQVLSVQHMNTLTTHIHTEKQQSWVIQLWFWTSRTYCWAVTKKQTMEYKVFGFENTLKQMEEIISVSKILQT